MMYRTNPESDRARQPRFVVNVPNGIQLKIKVIPGASRSMIVGIHADRLKIKVAVPATQGQANQAVLDLLRQWLNTKAVEIIAGHGHAEKTVLVKGMSHLDSNALSACDAAPTET